jgi:pimeloyl-ACP methyl ester carboxylesterase
MGDVMGGCAFERIRDCVQDVDGAVRELRRRGYRDITLIGHSTGANKIAVYDHYKPRNQIKRYILLGGGDDTGLLYDQLGARRFTAALQKARTSIAAKRGDELVPPAISKLPMSWRAFYDMANPDGDYNVFPFTEVMRGIRLSRRPRFRYVRAIRKPALFLYGERDEYCVDSASATLAALADALGPKPNVELAIMADADHGFAGKEEELAQVIARWMEGGVPR